MNPATRSYPWQNGKGNAFNATGANTQNNSSSNTAADARSGRGSWRGSNDQGKDQNLGNTVAKARLEAFLKSRDGNGVTQTGAFSERSNRGGTLADSGRNVPNVFKQSDIQSRITDSKTKGDQSWARKFGNSNDKPNRSTGDKSLFPSDKDKRDGIVNLQDARRGLADRKLDSKNFDPQKINRNYESWRKDATGGKNGKVGDQRDWSGEWKRGDRFAAADGIRDYWKKHGDGKDTPFKGDWWKNHDHDGHGNHGGHDGHDGHDGHGGHDGHDGHGGHNGHDNHDGHGHGHDGHWDHWDHWGRFDHHHRNWWSWCSAPILTSWFSFGFPTASYWDYGPGEYIFCNDGVVYVNGVWFEPAPIFYERTMLIAEAAPVWTPAQAAEVDWLPLGVFAVARDGVVDNNLLVQLAVTKEGVLGGTLFNQLTGVTFPINGMVDKESQRAVWMFTDDTGAQVMMESSIFNLTQPEATGLVHYGPDNIQVIEFVRLEDPNAGQ